MPPSRPADLSLSSPPSTATLFTGDHYSPAPTLPRRSSRLRRPALLSPSQLSSPANCAAVGDHFWGHHRDHHDQRALWFAHSRDQRPSLCIACNGNSSTEINLDEADVASEFKDIPDTFVDILQKNYPLVITFDKFLMMLDGTLGNSFFERFHEAGVPSYGSNIISRSVALQTFMRLKKVTFERFCSLYWPHFNSNLTKKLDRSRVFTEIISHIKGGLQGGLMDFVYIDEVQDLSMRQISLFKYICQNVVEGFVFAGDTAQTIARGIDFRFQDIRSLFYKEFLSNRTTKSQEKGLVSEIFQLKQNFRTHAARVLDLSQSVIEILPLLCSLIDILEPETSLISGDAPVLLESGNDENTISGGTGGGSGGEILGFGAEQVILVHDDCAKTEICEYVGKQALVLKL